LRRVGGVHGRIINGSKEAELVFYNFDKMAVLQNTHKLKFRRNTRNYMIP